MCQSGDNCGPKFIGLGHFSILIDPTSQDLVKAIPEVIRLKLCTDRDTGVLVAVIMNPLTWNPERLEYSVYTQ